MIDGLYRVIYLFFFFQAEDGIRDLTVTGVQTCALPISPPVAIAIASPGSRARGAGTPAAMRATTGNRAGASSARTANPSIAELGNGGRSIVAHWSAASTRPAAPDSGTSSASSGAT